MSEGPLCLMGTCHCIGYVWLLEAKLFTYSVFIKGYHLQGQACLENFLDDKRFCFLVYSMFTNNMFRKILYLKS